VKLLEHPPPVRDEPRRAPVVIIPEARQRERLRRIRIGLAVVLILAIGATVGGVVGRGGARTGHAASAPPKSLPVADARALAHTTLLLWPAGPVPATTPWPAGVGGAHHPNEQPVLVEHLGTGRLTLRALPRTEDGVVQLSLLEVGQYLVYRATGSVWALASNFEGRVRQLGRARFFVPSATPGEVWLVHTGYGTTTTIQAVSVNSGRLGQVVVLPQDASILRGTAAGLLLVSHGELELWTPGGMPSVIGNLGERGVGAVFASDARVVAYGTGCRYTMATPGGYAYTFCKRLRVVDLVTGRRLSFPAPPGTGGWVPPPTTVHDLSPNGGELAAEASTPPARKDRTEEFVLSLSGRRHPVTPVPSSRAHPYVRTAWSPDGLALLFQGSHKHLDVFLPSSGRRYQSSLPWNTNTVSVVAVSGAR
jgi:hypothetical protein